MSLVKYTRPNPIAVFLENFESEHTKTSYKTILQDFINLHQGASIEDIQLEHFVAYKRMLQTNGRSESTVAQHLSCLKSFFKFLKEQKWITVDPTQGLKVPKAITKTPTEALTDNEVKRIIEASKDDTDTVILTMLLHLGIRRAELLNIKKKDIYEVEDFLVVRVKGKGGKVRELPIVDWVKPTIAKLTLDKQDNDVLIMLDASNVYRRVKSAAKRAGITKAITPHSCRATAITKAIEAGAVITDVADFAGHSSISTTQLYWKRRNGLKNSPTFKLKYSS